MAPDAELVIRGATLADLAGMLACDERAQADEHRRDDLARWVAQGACLVACAGEAPIGFVVLDGGFFGHGFIALLIVARAHQRQGVALRLLAHAERRCPSDKLFTSTNASNLPAQRLFASAGFVRSGQIEHLDAADPELVFFKPVAAPANGGGRARPVTESELRATAARMEARLRALPSPAAQAAFAHYTQLLPRFEADLAAQPRDLALAKASALMLVQRLGQPDPMTPP